MLIELSDFIEAARRNVARIRAYRSLADGSDGTCDCIGLIVGAKRLAGGDWHGLHGCNYAIRNEMTTLRQINSEDDFFPGEIVYKIRNPLDDDYDLPERYREGGAYYNGDLNDYFHIGIVLGTSPLEIAHCTKDNPTAIDHEKRRWLCGGTLRGVDYRSIGIQTEETEGIVTIMSDDGKRPIVMRATGSLSALPIGQIQQGTEVKLAEKGRTWSKVLCGNTEGYVLNKYIYSENPEEFWFEEQEPVRKHSWLRSLFRRHRQ